MKSLLRAPGLPKSRSARRVFLGALVVLGALSAARGQPAATAQYQAYRLRHQPAAEVEKIAAQMLAREGADIHVVADPAANQILVRGSAKAQQLVRDLIATIDVPAEAALGRPEEDATVRAHACEASRQGEAIAKLRSLYAPRDDVRVAADPRGGKLLVLAPPTVHEKISRYLDTFRGGGIAPAEAGRTAGAEGASGFLEQFVPLVRLPEERIETVLRELLGPRLVPAGQQHQYRFVGASGRRVDLVFDRGRNGVRVAGAALLVGQFVRLIEHLEADPDGAGRVVQAVPLRNADPSQVREAVEAYRAGATEAAPRRLRSPGSEGRGTRGLPGGASGPDGNDQSRRHAHAGIDLVSYLFQPGGGGAAPGAAGAEAPAPPPDAAGPQAPAKAAPGQPPETEDRRDRLREFGPDVDIETLPDLDVIILRGRERDVQELRRIIEEIERLSVETQPVIEVYPLKHVRDDAMSRIVRQVEADLIAGRQGRVSITPLAKPNALLLIGWGEAVKAAKELIAKLDQPVAPETQQRIFRLKHASAATVSTTMQQFFQGQAGLGARVHVTADPRTNSLIVEAAPRDMAEVELLVERLDTDSPEAVLQTRIFKLQNTLANDVYATLQDAIEAAQGGGRSGQKSAALELLTVDPKGERVLKSGILNDVRITPDVRLNTLIVAAPAASMDLLAALIRQLDSPGTVAQIKVFRVVNADANAMILMLRGLLPAQGGGAQLSAAEGEPSIVPMRFSSDSRTNSIIAVGSPGDLKIVEALLLRLDTQDVQQRKTEVYRLKNSPANDVALAVNDLLRSQRQLLAAAPGAVSPFQQIESEVVIVPEPVSNSLIICATPRFFEEIRELVEKLDAAPSQVMIQVLIADLTLRNTDEFGVELGLQDSVLFNRSLLDKIFTITNTTQQSTPSGIITSTQQEIVSATNTPGYNFNGSDLGNAGSSRALSNASQTGGQGLSNFSLGRMNNELGYGGLVLSASSESVSVLIRALQESQRLEVLGRPQVMTLDNQPAFIQIGKRVPRITGTQVNQIGQANTIDLVNVGLILGVTPRISPEGMVVMEIDAEKSDVGPEAEGIPVSISGSTVIRSPSFNTTMAQTTVSARDGETIVLGGLITRNTTKVERKVPYLGDVPLLGNLFKYDLTQNKRTELLIILTPHIVRTPEEAERIKRVESARMHWCLEDVYQVHGDSGLSKNGGQVIYPDSNPRGTTPGESAVPKPARNEKAKSEEPTAPGLEAIPPSLPLPEPIPPPPKAGRVPSRSAPSEPSARTPPASSQWPPRSEVVPAGYQPENHPPGDPE